MLAQPKHGQETQRRESAQELHELLLLFLINYLNNFFVAGVYAKKVIRMATF